MRTGRPALKSRGQRLGVGRQPRLPPDRWNSDQRSTFERRPPIELGIETMVSRSPTAQG
jgi:hypothetical protein